MLTKIVPKSKQMLVLNVKNSLGTLQIPTVILGYLLTMWSSLMVTMMKENKFETSILSQVLAIATVELNSRH